MGLEAESRLTASDMIRLKELEMERQWPGSDLGQLMGCMQRHWAVIGTRLGLRVEEGKVRLVTYMSKFDPKPPGFGIRQPQHEIGKLAQTLFAGFLGWRNDIQQIGKEGKTRLLQISATKYTSQKKSVKPLFASLSHDISSSWDPKPLFQLAMSTEQVSRRLDGVPVYTVGNSANEFILISDVNSQKSLGIFCFRQEDAESLLSQVRDREPSLGRGAKVVAVSLDKVEYL